MDDANSIGQIYEMDDSMLGYSVLLAPVASHIAHYTRASVDLLMRTEDRLRILVNAWHLSWTT